MNKMKKLSFLAMIPVAALLLSGCGKQTVPTTTTPPVEKGFNMPNPALQDSNIPKAGETESLSPLPTDNKQAIETEVQSIDKELQQIDTTLSSDAMDAELGL
ncbi:MAG: hypothetical protein US25_C0060G0003 [Candidatus Moranbacteria bacterium GW2011_GWE1_36_7]|nr:MAG: hypothetical protein UR99_C0004G0021 [Candidatus Moranbacteria bacterium GW2011_GWD2_36_12]KKQ06931.1 MAG: hypothetical protein US16_C0006G0021 [Candidatus Moranbacteria bacterium GW2011_GWE2_36_40]KKQ12211.1 MAG: hypothetical protein US25_C0060G0003 [Candidatus Moranbacteria bacterium GW2011_GWE1_36_7]